MSELVILTRPLTTNRATSRSPTRQFEFSPFFVQHLRPCPMYLIRKNFVARQEPVGGARAVRTLRRALRSTVACGRAEPFCGWTFCQLLCRPNVKRSLACALDDRFRRVARCFTVKMVFNERTGSTPRLSPPFLLILP